MDFLIFGTVWFWILTILTTGFIIFLMEDALTMSKDSGGGLRATFMLLLYTSLYALFGSSEHIGNIFSYAKNHAGSFLLIIVSYLFVGVIWSVVKWYFYVLNQRDEFRSSYNKNANPKDHIPVARKNKSKILSWMMYWPFSALWTLINDPVRRAFRIIYNRIESYFDKISKSMFSSDMENHNLDVERKKEEKRQQTETM